MTAIRQIALTLYGQQIDQQEIAIGETVLWTLTLQDAIERAAIDLTGDTVIMSLCALNGGVPVYPPIIPRQADISSPSTAGICTVAWAVSDTVPSGVPVAAGLYGVDVWTIDGDGNRLQNMGFGFIKLTNPATLPNVEVVPLPAQVPLGAGATTFRYAVGVDDGDDFYVAIPAAAQAPGDYGVNITLASATAFVAFSAPIADRTQSEVHVLADVPLDSGTVLEITIYRIVS